MTKIDNSYVKDLKKKVVLRSEYIGTFKIIILLDLVTGAIR